MVAVGGIFISLFSLLAYVSFVTAYGQRKLEMQLNPNCTSDECEKGINGSFANLVYIRASGETDDLHYVFSTIHTPAVFVIQTSPGNMNLEVNWNKLLNSSNNSDALSLSGKGNILYSFGMIFTKLLEYNDAEDTADLNSYPLWNSTERNNRLFSSMKWMKVRKLTDGTTGFVFNCTDLPKESQHGNKTKNPSLTFTFRVYGGDGRESLLPHLMFTQNTSQFDFTINSVKPAFAKSRFALEMALFSNNTKDDFKMNETKSIDDEYSPGVFRIVDLSMGSGDGRLRSFLQWKPVCYKDTPRSRKVATNVRQYNFGDIRNMTDQLTNSIIHAFLGDILFNNTVAKHSLNISFGLSTDGFYTKTNYTSWSATLGFGNAPVDKISFFVIAIISSGLGIPVVIILCGGVFICVKKRRGMKSGRLEDVSASYPQVN